MDVRMGRIRHRFWVPTEEMLSNYGTKLEGDGTLPMGEIDTVRRTGEYRIAVLYKANSAGTGQRRTKAKPKPKPVPKCKGGPAASHRAGVVT